MPPRRPELPPALLATLAALPFAIVYFAVGLVRFNAGRAGSYDLGIFSQAAQSWSEGRLPGSHLRGLDNLFADHFSPITAVFGLGWLAWGDPRALLAIQALAVGGAVLVFSLAAFRHLPGWPALALVVAAGLAKGFASTVVFDVHEAAFGALLISGLCWAVLEGRRAALVACAIGLLLVKEDLGLTVCVAGLVWLRRTGDRRTAYGLLAVGVSGFLLANVVVALANPTHHSPYLQFLFGSSGNPEGLSGAVVHGGSRLAPALLFACTLGFIGLRSSIAWLGVPTLLWRAASSNESYWQTYFHYDAILVPVAAFALLDVLHRSKPRLVVVAVAAVGVMISAWSGLAKLSAWPVWIPASYHLSSTMTDARTLGGQIPRGDAVAAQQDLGPMLLSCCDVYMLDAVRAKPVKWVLLTDDGSELGATQQSKRAWLTRQRARPDVRIIQRGSVTLIELPATESVLLPQ